MIRRLWITDDPHDQITDDTIAAAVEAGATEILSGIPPALADVIDSATRGYVELTIPDPEPPSDEVPEQVRFDAFAASLDEALSDPQVNSIAEFRAAIRDAIAVGRNVV